jgi:hypothetical protein
LCNRTPEGFELNVIRKAPFAVDLDDGQPLPVGLLESRIAGDIDLSQLEAELVAQRPYLFERAFAEVAAFGVVDDDLDHIQRAYAHTEDADEAAG